jgi:hypothetical protein
MIMALFVVLLLLQIYFMLKLFSYIDPELVTKYRFLGLFALLKPGVLRSGGVKFLLATICCACLLFVAGLVAFEMRDLLSG